MNYYIVGTRKEQNCSKVSEIQGYQVNTTKSSGGVYCKKSEFFSSHYNSHNKYESYNPNIGITGAECEKKTSINGEDYLQTIGNGTSSDNLLKLPNV